MKQNFKTIMACDVSIHEMAEDVLEILLKHGCDITDAGRSQIITDFTDSAEIVADAIQSGGYQKGILFCGSGIGVCMAANKFKGIRAGLAYDILPAALAGIDNNTNVLCTGAWTMESAEKCAKMIETWLMVGYSGRDENGMERTRLIEEQC